MITALCRRHLWSAILPVALLCSPAFAIKNRYVVVGDERDWSGIVKLGVWDQDPRRAVAPELANSVGSSSTYSEPTLAPCYDAATWSLCTGAPGNYLNRGQEFCQGVSFGGCQLGQVGYQWTGSEMAVLWGTANADQGCGALVWLTGDVNGDRQAEIIQTSRNGTQLGMTVYGWDGSGMRTLWGTTDIGQGRGSLAWLVSDINGDRKSEIIQPWRNGTQLGMTVYGWDGSGMRTLWGTTDIGQGYGALAWLVDDINGDRKSEIIRPRRNGTQLGMTVYGWDGSGMRTLWGTTDIAQGYDALAWLVGDINGDRKNEIIQPWRNGTQLGMTVYGWDGSGMRTLWGTKDIGRGHGALAWLTADVNADRKTEIIQPWRRHSVAERDVFVEAVSGPAILASWSWATPCLCDYCGAATHAAKD